MARDTIRASEIGLPSGMVPLYGRGIEVLQNFLPILGFKYTLPSDLTMEGFLSLLRY